MAEAYHTPNSSISSVASPTLSSWSRGHTSKTSSSSSMSYTSSPVQARDSLDLFGTQKRLEDVREEEDLPSRQVCSFNDYRAGPASGFVDQAFPVSQGFQGYSLADADQDTSSSTTSSCQHLSKRQRSLEKTRNSVTHGFTSHFGSLSRRWRNRSAVGPPLSIITNTTPITSPRTSLDTSANHYTRSASIKSNTQDIYSPASMHSFAEDTILEFEVVPIYIDQRAPHDKQEDAYARATTPLLPPINDNRKRQDSPIQSPLQSPSIAPTIYGIAAHVSTDRRHFSYLPSPPLSTRPSVASMPRSRANTATQDIPILHGLGERVDPWESKLGHADFSIHPEPFLPEKVDIDSYKEFRDNWDQARKQYAQHLVRTSENYGETSKVYKLTEEKWNSIDSTWKKYNDQLRTALLPQLVRLSDDPHTLDSPLSALDKPVTRIVVPQLDDSGKFPDRGDIDIIGPLSMGVAKVPELQRGALTPPTSPRKRDFIKTLGEKLFPRH